MSGCQGSKKTPPTTQDSATQKRGKGTAVRNKVGTMTRSDGGSSGSKKKMPVMATGAVEKPICSGFPAKVYDEAGVDVTPLPLVICRQNLQSMPDTTVSSPTDLLSQLSTGTFSVFGGGPFSRSVFTPSFETAESVADEESQGVGSAWADIRQKRLEVKEYLSEQDLDKEIIISLTETDTFWFLNVPTVCVAADSKEAEEIALDNAIYAKLCKSRAGNDLYAECGMNTFNEAVKYKSIQTIPVLCNSTGVECTNFDMYDSYAAMENKEAETDKEEELELDGSKKASTKEDIVVHLQQPTAREMGGRVSLNSSKREAGSKGKSIKESQCTISISSPASSVLFPSYETTVTAVSEASSLNESRILESDSIKEDLFVMERTINLNTYQSKQAEYRGFPDITCATSDTDPLEKLDTPIIVDDMGPNLDRLWSYICPLTKGHNVACMAWNKVNMDLLAVGYGQFEFIGQKCGLICCWCLKNPEFPERIYTCKTGVTALDFSTIHPNILGAGFYDGRVALYNVRFTNNDPLLDSQRDCSSPSEQGIGDSDSHSKHLGPVWQLRWMKKERGSGEEKAEVLISVSTDGHVMMWSIRNGFESFDIMRLKKAGTRMSGKHPGKAKKDEAIISRYAGGLCFDFDATDPNVYLVGTEEGNVHKCSCSYNEQYLETYTGHTGPVYRVRWSPFVPKLFLSCSADWTLRLWHKDQTTPILTFHSSTKQVPDLCWSPRCSTVFACVNEGCVEVWDLSQSTLDPVITLSPTYSVKLSSITFGRNADCILVGDSEGQVTVYQLRCMPPYPAMEDQAQVLLTIANISHSTELTTQDARAAALANTEAEKEARIKSRKKDAEPSESEEPEPKKDE